MPQWFHQGNSHIANHHRALKGIERIISSQQFSPNQEFLCNIFSRLTPENLTFNWQQSFISLVKSLNQTSFITLVLEISKFSPNDYYYNDMQQWRRAASIHTQCFGLAHDATFGPNTPPIKLWVHINHVIGPIH